MTDSLCILSHLAVKYFISTAIRIVNSIKTAGSDTAAAALAFDFNIRTHADDHPAVAAAGMLFSGLDEIP